MIVKHWEVIRINQAMELLSKRLTQKTLTSLRFLSIMKIRVSCRQAEGCRYLVFPIPTQVLQEVPWKVIPIKVGKRV